jgi:hypothetical protein
VFQWLAAWTNKRGDVVQYTLRYRVSGEAKPTGQDAIAEVLVVRMTPKTLAEFRRQVRETKRKIKISPPQGDCLDSRLQPLPDLLALLPQLACHRSRALASWSG